jgi:Fe-S-cluster containining protein
MIPCDKCPAKFDKSKSHCCGIIPFPLKFLEEHKKFFRAEGELKDDGNQAIILTKDFLCVFYDRLNHKCAIYEERPQVCKDYGMIEALPCPYFKRSGNRRSPASEKITLREIGKRVDKAVKRGELLDKRR